ncbi:hypothetical protein H5410_037683 [Solanum commersonii]|uniref:Uncharacterized protein n=1 Tax=Solanum commersonii TaxID=4109 RepID=A0A9J5Y6Y5_SOLCO|nr:hypothetical protein H5410_037683 [Solanum commersonii]
MQRMFARNKISYHEYQEVEKVIEITQTTGKHKLNLLTKPMIEQILKKIPEKKRKKMNYVHLGGIQILVKSTFKEWINCSIVINLSDERFINAREGNPGKNVYLFKPCNHLMNIYTVPNFNYGSVYKNKEMIEIDQECAGITRIVEAETQQAQILEEYEIRFGKTKEIGSPSNNPRLSLEYGRNSIRKRLQEESLMELNEKKKDVQTGATANHAKWIIWDGLPIYEGTPYIYKTLEGNNFSCKNMVDLLIQLDTIRITVPCYITNHESDHNLILGNLFLNSLNNYSIGKNGI